MFNNYEKMKEMESVLTSAFPVSGKESITAQPKLSDDEIENGELLVEEAQGKVSPTLGTETMSPTYSGDSLPDSETGQIPEQSDQLAWQEETQTEEVLLADSNVVEQGGEHEQQAESTVSVQQETAAMVAQPTGEQITYQVQDGETLYSICLKFYHSLSRVEEVCQLNNLENPDKIISGQNLILP